MAAEDEQHITEGVWYYAIRVIVVGRIMAMPARIAGCLPQPFFRPHNSKSLISVVAFIARAGFQSDSNPEILHQGPTRNTCWTKFSAVLAVSSQFVGPLKRQVTKSNVLSVKISHPEPFLSGFEWL
jgi:hypothetical protein